MTITRKFLGLARPALVSTAEYLCQRFAHAGNFELRNVIIVVPGRRAGRRLLEVLVEHAENRALVLTPPVIETVGRLPEQLYKPQRPFANDLIQRLAWTEALRAARPETITPIIPSPPHHDDFERWMTLGDLLRRQHIELAADGLDFGDVAERGRNTGGFVETARWHALNQIQQAYLRLLDGLQLWDVQTARLVAIEKRECQTDKQIVLLGTVDMNVTQRRMLDQVADHVTALVFASDHWADRFDPHGCVVPATWADVEIPIDMQRVHVADDPADQADEVVRCIASFDGKYRADEITIGAADEQIVPQIQRQLNQCELPSRWGPGRLLSESGPFRLVGAISNYLSRGRFVDFAALVRHPDMEQWLASAGVDGDWLTELDKYQNKHLPSRLGDDWLGGVRKRQRLEKICAAVNRLVEPLRGAPRPLDQWTDLVLEALQTVYGERQFDRDDATGRMSLSACEKVRDALLDHGNIPSSLAPRVSAADAIEWTRQSVESETVPPPADEAAIELLGWLELTLDDAPALIVTSFHEGLVPDSINSDLFLPNSLRQQLGLMDNARRYARDAYALSVLLASRERLDVIVGRRNSDGDPVAPSRLLFAADPQEIARRTLTLFQTPKSLATKPPLAGSLTTTRETANFSVPRPSPLSEPITRMSVTSFRAYLACPYRFYLRYVLGLKAIRDDADELDGAAFGTLIHEVLQRFGSGPCRDSTDPDEIRDVLFEQLNKCKWRFYGRNPRAAVEVQLAQMRLRLGAFADQQATWATDGWQIEHIEVPGTDHDGSDFEVDGKPITLSGRIDRIDVHRETGRWMILDYKSSDTAKPPKKTHQCGNDWVDLQLPLYRHLSPVLKIDGPIELGYINLPKDVTKTGFCIAQWSDEELASADERARDVVRNIRGEAFWPPTDPPPPFSEEYAPICLDGVFDKWNS